jgi:protein TonB
VSAPVPLQRTEPDYSEEARAARLQGTLVVTVVVGTDGLAHDVRVVQGLGLGLDENALEAIGQWQFKPGVKDGQPVKVAATIEVNFRLL